MRRGSQLPIHTQGRFEQAARFGDHSVGQELAGARRVEGGLLRIEGPQGRSKNVGSVRIAALASRRSGRRARDGA
jgi:hypothetical protein